MMSVIEQAPSVFLAVRQTLCPLFHRWLNQNSQEVSFGARPLTTHSQSLQWQTVLCCQEMGVHCQILATQQVQLQAVLPQVLAPMLRLHGFQPPRCL